MATGIADFCLKHVPDFWAKSQGIEMNVTTVGVGVVMVAFGLLTTVLRILRPGVFSKLGPMKARWGDRAGFWLHVFGYSAVPIVVGAAVAFQGWSGAALF